ILALLFLSGPSGLKVRYREFGSVPASSRYLWDSDRGPDAGPQPLPRLPDWWTSKAPPAGGPAKDMTAALDLLAARLTPKVSLDVALAEAGGSSLAASRALALRCYAATDDLTSLRDALLDEQHDDIRLMAIDVLRQWIALRADHDQRLFQLLGSKGFSEAHTEIIMQLLHSFSNADINNPSTYETLIEYLPHDRLPIRKLAYWHLVRLVPEGAKYSYNPTGSAEQREKAYEQWKKLVPTGKLPPKPKPAPGKGP